MSQAAFISICIPTYNQTSFLSKTLDSIARQTYTNFEVIVSDDSNTDDVMSLVNSYTSKFKIIYSRNSPSLGSPANWNKAMDLSTGEWVKFMHHDDWFEGDTALQDFAAAISQSSNLNFIFCNSRILNVKDNTISFNIPSADFLEELSTNPKILFNRNLIGAPSAVLFRKSELRFDVRTKYVVDLDFYIAYLTKHPQFEYINAALITNTSHHAGQVTAQSMTASVQIGEYAYLYEKLYDGKIPNLRLTKFFFFLFRQYPLKQLESILEFNRPLPRPIWYFRLVLAFAKASLMLRKVKVSA